MIDAGLILAGIVLLLFGSAMLALYLTSEKGTILDPISISWAGFIMFVAFAMIFVGIFRGERATMNQSALTIATVFLGTLCFTVGLYSGKAKWIASAIPRPRGTLSLPEIWFMWLFAVTLVIVTVGMAPFVPGGFKNVIAGIIDGSIGATALLAVMVLFGYRGQFATKFVMLATLAGVAGLVLAWYWSRRPLVGILVACGAFFYRTRIMHKSAATRAMFLGGLAIGAVLLMLFLGATRGRRFYGAAGGQNQVLSSRNFMDFVSGLTINYEALEFSLEQFPRENAFLLGKGFVPAFTFLIPRSIWPTKPVSSGYVVSQLWYNTKEPDNNIANIIIGEMYINFGFIGVIAGMFLIGQMVRGLNTFMLRETANKVIWPAWLLILPDFATEWRGDFTSMTVQAFLRISVFIGLAWLASKAIRGAPAAASVSIPRGALPAMGRPRPGLPPPPGRRPARRRPHSSGL